MSFQNRLRLYILIIPCKFAKLNFGTNIRKKHELEGMSMAILSINFDSLEGYGHKKRSTAVLQPLLTLNLIL